MRIVIAAAASAMLLSAPAVAAPAGAPVAVVAAENFYGDLAGQIGGPGVKVVSIMSNPDQDPHLFEASAQTARDLAEAQLVIYNGADYDPWMAKLLAAHRAPHRLTIVIAELVHKKAGDNPHLWYDPKTMPAAAKALVADLAKLDPEHGADYRSRLNAYLQSLEPIAAKIAEMRKQYAGIQVTATEPVAGYMADALGLKMRNMRFQIAVMNNAEPRASDVAAFQNDLKGRKAKVLLYNSQATDDLTKKMRDIATEAKIPVVGVSETEPPGTSYQEWMLHQLDDLDHALAGAAP
jgi:zinc/manganese transport system substrate-binding protein